MARGAGIAVPHQKRQAQQLILARRHAVQGAVFENVNPCAEKRLVRAVEVFLVFEVTVW